MAHVTFIHGIANKPAADRLIDVWTRNLADADGLDLGSDGVTSTMVYWADVLYETPLQDGALESATNEAVSEGLTAEAPDLGVENMSAEERAWVATLGIKLAVPLVAAEAVQAVPAAREMLERIPLPWPLKERLMRRLLRDVHHYLFNVEFSPRPGATYKVQDEIRARMLNALDEGAGKPGPHVVVSHSMGTVIAYDCLKRVARAPVVDGLMTIGSPLGLDEIQDKLAPEWTPSNGFPSEKVHGDWINVYDSLDPVAGLDPRFANDYRRDGADVVEDVNENNSGAWRHDISKYLHGPQLRDRLRKLLRLA